MVNFACTQAGVNPDEVLSNHNGIPCETFSIASKSGKGRKFKGSVHGCNFRNNDKYKTPCCPASAGCKYVDTAREHDKIAKKVKSSIQYDYSNGATYEFGIENVNPKADLSIATTCALRPGKTRCTTGTATAARTNPRLEQRNQ